MSDQLRLLLSASINVGKSISEINSALKAIESHPSLQKIKLKINIDTSTLSSFITAVNKMKKISEEQNKVVSENVEMFRRLDGSVMTITQRITKSGEVLQKTKVIHDENRKVIQDEAIATQKLTQAVEQQNKAEIVSIAILKNRANAITGYRVVSSQGYTTTSQKIESDGKTLVGSTVTTNHKKQRQDELKAQEEILQKTRTNLLQEEKEYQKFVNEVKKQYDNLQSNIRKNLLQEERDTESFINRAKKQYDSLINKQEDLVLRIRDIQRRYSGDKNLVGNLDKLSQEAGKINLAQDGDRQLERINKQLKEYVNNANSARSNSISFSEAFSTAMQKFPVWMAATTAFYAPIHMLQDGVRQIYELDTALTDLKKVTDETAEEYKRFALEANKTANSVGGLTVDVIKATTEWARLGYTMEQSKALAKETIVYQNVGDIKKAEDASQALISAIKGFNIEVDKEGKNITKVVDIYNEVGNKFAISSAGIGEAMRRSAASLAEAGNTIEQSVALATAANSTIQDPARVGQMLKTVSMRLRGVSDEGEDLSDLLPTLEKKFQAIGLTLKKDETTFKNTYDIFKDLSSVWSKLTDMQRAEILEGVAGKLQGNIAASLINNFKDAEGSLQAGLNSFGSAARENEKYLDSMKGKMFQLKNAATNFWQNSLDSEGLKTVISIATKFISALDNMGNAALLLSGVLIAFKSRALADLITGAISSTQALLGLRTSLATTAAVSETTAVAVNGATVAMTGLQRALGIIGLVITAGSLLYTVLNQVDNSTEKLSQTIEKNNKKYSDTANQISEVLSYYKENYSNISTNIDVKDQLFQLQNKLIDTFGKEAKGIDLINGKYDEQIKKITDLNNVNLKNKIKDDQFTVDAIKAKKYSDPRIQYDPTLKHELGLGDTTYSIGGDIGFGNLGIEEYYNKLQDIYKQLQVRKTEVFSGTNLIPKNEQEWANALNTIKDKLNEIKPLYDQINALENDKKQQIKESTLEQTKLNEEQQKAFDQINAALSTSPTEDYAKNISSIAQVIEKTNGGDFLKTLQQIKEMPNIASNSSLLNELNKLESGIKKNQAATLDLKSIQKKLSEAYQATYEKVEPLNQAIDKYRQGTELTSNEIGELLKKYPDLISSITSENGMLKINVEALIAKRDAEIDGANVAVNSQKTQVESQEKALIAKLQFYNKEIDAIDSVAKAKDALAKATEGLADKQAKGELSDQQVMDETLRINNELRPQLESIAKAKEAIKALQEASNNKFNFINTTNTPKPSNTPSPFDESQKYQIDLYKQSLRNLDAQIKESESVMTRYKETSEEYRIELQKQIEINKEKQKLTAEEGIRLRTDIKELEAKVASTSDQKKQNEYLQQLDQARNNLAALSSSWWDYEISVEQSQKKLKESLYSFSKDWIINEKSNMELLGASEVEVAQMVYDAWKRVSDKREQFNTEQQDEINKNLVQANNELKKAFMTQSEQWIQDETDRMTLAGASEIEIAQMVYDARKRMADEQWTAERGIIALSAKEQLKADKDVYDAQKKLLSLQEQNQKKIADNTKNIANQLKDAYSDYYDGLISAEDKRHEKTMDNLDEEMKKTQDAVDLIKKSMDRDSATEDYNLALSKTQKEAQDIQDQINLYQFDNSIEGKAKLLELEKEYAAKQEEIQKLQRDRTKKLREDNLDDVLDSKKKEIDAAKKTEDEKYRINKESLDNQKKAAENYWNEIITNDEKFTKFQNDIISSHFENITNEMEGFKNNISSISSVIGQAVSEGITSKLTQAQEALSNLSKNPTGDSSNNYKPTKPSTPNSSFNYYQPKDDNEQRTIDMMKQNSKKWDSADEETKKQLHQSNQGWASLIGATYSNGTWFKGGLPLYHDGGEVGVQGTSFKKWLNLNSSEIIGKLKLGEVVMNNPIQNVVDIIKRFVPDMSNIKSNAISGVGDTYNLSLNIASLTGDKAGGETVLKTVVKGLQKMGKQ